MYRFVSVRQQFFSAKKSATCPAKGKCLSQANRFVHLSDFGLCNSQINFLFNFVSALKKRRRAEPSIGGLNVQILLLKASECKRKTHDRNVADA